MLPAMFFTVYKTKSRLSRRFFKEIRYIPRQLLGGRPGSERRQGRQFFCGPLSGAVRPEQLG